MSSIFWLIIIGTYLCYQIYSFFYFISEKFLKIKDGIQNPSTELQWILS